MPKGAHGIDSGGAAGRKIAGQKSQSADEQNGGGDGERIDPAHAEEKALQPAGGTEGERQTGPEAKRDENQRITQNHPDDTTALRSNGHANADFHGPSGYRVSQRPVDADRSQQKSEQSEDAAERGNHLLLIERFFDLSIERGDAENGKLTAHLPECLTHFRRDSRRRGGGAEHHFDIGDRLLPE